MKYSACLGVLLLEWQDVGFFVCLYRSGFREKQENEKGKLNWLVLGNMGGISFDFISSNFNLKLPALF